MNKADDNFTIFQEKKNGITNGTDRKPKVGM